MEPLQESTKLWNLGYGFLDFPTPFQQFPITAIFNVLAINTHIKHLVQGTKGVNPSAKMLKHNGHAREPTAVAAIVVATSRMSPRLGHIPCMLNGLVIILEQKPRRGVESDVLVYTDPFLDISSLSCGGQ